MWLCSISVMYALTFTVSVPEGTQRCYVVGAFNGWDTTSALELQQIEPNKFQLDVPAVTSVAGGFKYLCGPGPGWTYVEKNADGTEITNRTVASANDVVVRWAAFYLPDLPMGAVTINVTVPENTPDNKVYIYGSFQEWIVSDALPLTKISPTQYTITIDGVTQFNFKMLCGKSTDFVEIATSGAEIPDRNATSNNPTMNIVVQKWKNVPKTAVGVTYLENNIPFSPLNGIRNIWVYLPPDYHTNTTKSYPVLYMQDGQNVFVDSDGVGSWDVSATLNQMYVDGKDVGIVVGIDKAIQYNSEYSPFVNDAFGKTGEGDKYLQAIINNVIPYINTNYRTLTGPENTAIAGSGMGGLISYYGALAYQQVFGKAGVFSPMFWFNKSRLTTYLDSWNKQQAAKMYIISGSLEGNTMNTDATLFFNQTKQKGYSDTTIKREIVAGGVHSNQAWGMQFRRVYAFLFDIDDSNNIPEPTEGYQFMSHSASSVACVGNEPFTQNTYYANGNNDSEVNVLAYLKTIPVEMQSTYFWNINRGSECNGLNVFATNKSVGFSSSKTAESWLRVIIFDDESTADIAASSAHFRVKKADGTIVVMSRTKADGTEGTDDSFSVSAEVTFPTENKNFEICFGSVNSGAVQGSLVGTSDTYPLTIAPTCTKAQIIYSFKTNKVTIICLEGTTPLQEYQFMSHSGSSVACAGNEPFVSGRIHSSGDSNTFTDAMVYLKTIPIAMKSTYYWNINEGAECDGNNLFASNKSIGFSSSKTAESWLRAIVYSDKSTNDMAVSSAHFRVKKADGTLLLMSRTKADGTEGTDDSFTVAAEVTFLSENKNFEIRFGSVNSGAVQGSLVGGNDTYPIQVPTTCTKAKILFSFKTNLVTIICLEGDTPAQSYQFMSHSGSSVACAGNEPYFSTTYHADGTNNQSANVMMYIKTVPMDMKSMYYWNVNRGATCTGDNMSATNKSVGFSSSKTSESWIRSIVFENETLQDAAASSTHFRVKTGAGLLALMTRTKSDGSEGADNSFTVSAIVDFSVSKSFEIRFGSVNSGAVQGSLVGSSDTYPLSVPNEWQKAKIMYSFKTNIVTMEQYIDPVILPTITYIKAIPSVCQAGTPVHVYAKIDNQQNYVVSCAIAYNNGSFTPQNYTINENNELAFELTPAAGIYHIRVRVAENGSGQEVLSKIIAVKVLGGIAKEMLLTVNPYQGINWNTIGKYKANFHLHTNWTSDASMPAHQVVDLYHSKNFKILPITNHNFSSYPWSVFSMFKSTWQDRDADALGMLTFPANELSANNHHNDYFTGRNDNGANLEESFALTKALGGMQIINHPGQYWSIHTTYTGLQKNSPAWHVDNFKRYESLVGLEVYNQGNKQPNDRILWDDILTLSMPDRPIWGYSNDDAHHTNQAFFNYQFMLMEQFNIATLKESMKKGKTVFSYEYGGSGNALAPTITNIQVDDTQETITIHTNGYDVYWISGTEGFGSNRKSSIVGYGNTFNYQGFQGNYVRAFITNAYGETCSQPFGFDKKVQTAIQTNPISELEEFVIYPNPSKGFLSVSHSQPIQAIKLQTLMGQTMQTINTEGKNQLELNVSDIPSGVYIITCKTTDSIQTKTIIIQK